MADTHRDTVRGRKARKADLSLVSEYERLIRVEQSRKQQLLTGRYDWFPNLVDENAEPD